jgi:hypothetical protein
VEQENEGPAAYEPRSPSLVIVKSRLSPKSWAARVEAAQQADALLRRIEARVNQGETLNEATAREAPRSRRSWVMGHWKRWKREGLEALIDARLPREPTVSRECESIIQAARQTDPTVSVGRVLEILKEQRIKVLPSESTIKRHFTRVDGRRKYAQRKAQAKEKVVELPLAGGELLLAAEVESGAMQALTREVEKLAEEAREASVGREPERDVENRDARGHFTAAYNRKRKRKPGEEIAGYLRSAEEKAEGRVPAWPRFVHEGRETLGPKLEMLTLAPLVSETKGWDALRAPEVAGLESLTGFAYMPSTLQKLTSALALSAAGPRMLEAVGANWHRVAQERWKEGGAMAALYIDNQAKEVWTSLFTKSGKVSNLNRVMPCITTTYVHTGAGTPLVASVSSGSAPLAPRLVQIVKEAETKLGEEGEVKRAVVIDAEGSTFDILEAFAKEGRVIVTPLRPTRAPELELTYSRGSYYRPYREKDELRVASAALTHKSTGRKMELGALLVRREHRESDTVLLTTGLSLGMEGRDLADLYFERWPLQENFFKHQAAVGLDEHRGNSGRMVANVAVVTELERLQSRMKADEEELERLAMEKQSLSEKLEEARGEHQRAVETLAQRRGRLDELVEQERCEGREFTQAATEHQRAIADSEKAQEDFEAAQVVMKKQLARETELKTKRDKAAARYDHLEDQKKIRQLDVALDSVLTAAKLTLALLITFAIREYFVGSPMTPQTFISRIFSMKGRRVIRPGEEHIVFYENPRDPAMSQAIAAACRELNQRTLVRRGRRLHYSVEPSK